MCKFSSEHVTRRARLDETLVIQKLGKQKVAVPEIQEAGIECACMKTGDKVQCINLPHSFQTQHDVPLNAVALFIEAPSNNADRDNDDKFDFQNGEVVPMRNMFKGIKFQVRELVNQPRPKSVLTEAGDRQPLHTGVLVQARNSRAVQATLGAMAITVLGFAGYLSRWVS